MKPAKFEYFAPTDLDAVLHLLAQYGDDAKLLAGGQTLVPTMNFRLAKPKVIIDLNRVAGLDGIREEGDDLVIGAMTRQRTIEDSVLIERCVPLLHEATRWIAHLPIRTRGTIGGSIANADPAAEDPAVALALDAVMVMRNKRGERRVAAVDFFRGLLTTALASDELLSAIRFPKAKPNSVAAFAEISKRHGDFALAGVGAQITVTNHRVSEARLAACGVGPGPVRLGAAEAILQDALVSANTIERAADAAALAVSPPSDLHGSADYRRKLTRTMTRDALTQAAARASIAISNGAST